MFTRDLAHAARSLVRKPGFTLTAVITIGLGIGATTAIFSVVHAVLLRPLPYQDPEKLVLLWSDLRNRNVRDFPTAPGDFKDILEAGTLFEQVGAVVTFRQAVVNESGQPEVIRVAQGTSNLFTVLGSRIALGRGFIEADAEPQPAPPPVTPSPVPNAATPPPLRLPTIVVLSDGYWRRRFGADSGVIGKNLELAGGPAQVVGVLEPSVELLWPPKANIERNPDVYTAMRINFDSASRINVFMRVVARLKPTATIEQAQSQMDRLSADLRERFPIKKTAGTAIRLEPMQKNLVAAVKPAIVALMGAVIFVLLIACANVANLLLVRAAWRERELALRSALGGSRSRLITEMLAESLVLAAGGGVLGIGIARLGIALLVRMGPQSLPRLDTVTISLTVLCFTLGACLAAAAIFGVVPALRASRPDAMEVLRPSGRSHGLRTGKWLRNGVVMAEVALSFILLVGTGLMFRSFLAIARTDPGFEPSGLLTFVVQNNRVRSRDELLAFEQQMSDRLKALPGVRAVTAASTLPLDGTDSNGRWGTETAMADPNSFRQGQFFFVQPGYFEAMQTRVIAGRSFDPSDLPSPPPSPPPGSPPQATPAPPLVRPIVVDEWVAARAFPGEPAIGKILMVRTGGPEPDRYAIIGVVEHQRHTTLSGEERESLFFAQHMGTARWVVRTTGNPDDLVRPVQAAVAEVNRLVPISEIRSMSFYVDQAIAPTRFALALIGIFAIIAAVLAVVGLYGVLSSVVRQRTSEIGVRVALGASRAAILRLVVGHGLTLSGAGVGLGLVGAFALTRVMNTMLVGVKATDPATFLVIAVLFLGVALAACWIPARRAAGLDPNSALRDE